MGRLLLGRGLGLGLRLAVAGLRLLLFREGDEHLVPGHSVVGLTTPSPACDTSGSNETDHALPDTVAIELGCEGDFLPIPEELFSVLVRSVLGSAQEDIDVLRRVAALDAQFVLCQWHSYFTGSALAATLLNRLVTSVRRSLCPSG